MEYINWHKITVAHKYNPNPFPPSLFPYNELRLEVTEKCPNLSMLVQHPSVPKYILPPSGPPKTAYLKYFWRNIFKVLINTFLKSSVFIFPTHLWNYTKNEFGPVIKNQMFYWPANGSRPKINCLLEAIDDLLEDKSICLVLWAALWIIWVPCD